MLIFFSLFFNNFNKIYILDNENKYFQNVVNKKIPKINFIIENFLKSDGTLKI